jgi:hypothetical protein
LDWWRWNSPLDPTRRKAVDIRLDYVPVYLGCLVDHESLLGRVLLTSRSLRMS